MKIMAYAKWNLEDWDKVSKKNNAIQEERKKFPNRYPKPLSPPYHQGTGRIFRLYEGTEEQFANVVARWVPEMKWQLAAIFDGDDLEQALKRIK
jgi:hypothetical protein